MRRSGGFLNGFGPVLGREVRAYLTSPLFYVVVGTVLAATSLLFLFLLVQFAQFSTPQGRAQAPPGFVLSSTVFIVNNAYYMIHFLLLFTLPILSMRLIAEERKAGTLELLVTHPVSDWGLLLGKYFGALAVVGVILLLTLPYPLALGWLGAAPEWSVVWSCFIGLALASAAYLAFGLFASSITESQIVAAVISYVGLFFFYVSGGLLGNVGGDTARRLSAALAIEPHFHPFTTGRVALVDVVYFLLFALFFLFLTAQVLGMRRWRV